MTDRVWKGRLRACLYGMTQCKWELEDLLKELDCKGLTGRDAERRERLHCFLLKLAGMLSDLHLERRQVTHG